MKIVRLILGIVLGLITITFVAEGIEFLIVKALSGLSFSALQENQDQYFSVRNTTNVLVAKIFYSLFAGAISGYLATWICGEKARLGIWIIIGIQVLSLIWGGFISDLSSTGPVWMWLYLILVIPLGIWLGYRLRKGSR